MIVRIITARVKHGREKDFERATVRNHEHSVNEPGVLRFDVLQDNETPGVYYLYEVYRDEPATAAHKKTDHYHRWRSDVEDMLDGERTAVACSVVAPKDPQSW
jgi:(4S)-4-hydroxy-5-phosphonooxypentane-2,3-dione isomerase